MFQTPMVQVLHQFGRHEIKDNSLVLERSLNHVQLLKMLVVHRILPEEYISKQVTVVVSMVKV